MSINEHRGRRAAAKVFDLLVISPEKLVDVGSGSRRLICCVPYTLKEKSPSMPSNPHPRVFH
jgi:hypothetical protein